MIIVSTERLTLRHIQPDDVDAFSPLFADPEVMRYGDGAQGRDWVEAWVQRAVAHSQRWGFGPYAVSVRTTGVLIGYCGLFHCDDINGRPEIEIGYRLIRSAWGQGYATEAALAVKTYATTTLGIIRLIAMIDPGNVASIRVAQKLGMHYEAEVMFDGYTHPDHVFVVNT
jgi:ribosomal-protein-alanine N-acetyltransferase